MTGARIGVWLLFFFFSSLLRSYSQPQKADEIKTICDKYPNEKCIALNESYTYSFAVKKKGKASAFVVKEDYSGTFVTTEGYYSKVNSVFYDDYSGISAVKYKINQVPFSNFPVIYTNYESEGIFHDDIKVCAYKMDMSKGKTYEVSYTKTYNNCRLFSRIFFHNNYPVDKATVSFEIPSWVEIEIKPVNFEGFAITQKETPNPSKKTKKIVYEISEVKAIPSESHSPNIAKFLPHLLIFIKSNSDPAAAEKYFSNPGDLYKWCKVLVDSVNNETESLKDILTEIKKNEKDSFKVMENIFYWVQDHVRYIAFENGIMGYKPMAAKKVCNMLYGDCKGMANLMKNLLKLAGYDARLTWIGTNDIPYSNELPTLAVYNHMICTAFLGGKKYFLDGTEQYIAINDYAERIQGRPVMIENGSSY
ncbi:MAG TPA: transglutaminase domain-containing protein, partial [Nitrosopumilaceae archaeon]|nr:transglutaminase domain-containing protein [Nitrosopumilaceae archaeon]